VATALAAGAQQVQSKASGVTLHCSNTAPAPKLDGKPLNLNGIYVWPPNQGKWWVRQWGTCVYQMAQNTHSVNDPNPTGQGFTGVFIGSISPNLTISGIWSGVPYGGPKTPAAADPGHGTLTWKIEKLAGKLTLVAIQGSGGSAVDKIIEQQAVTR
jgi:hypothetical protein